MNPQAPGGGSTALGRWVVRQPLVAHVLVPLALSAVLMGLYFSGQAGLQALITPDIEGVRFFVRREFGALEMAQNLVLLAVAWYALRCLVRARTGWLRGLLALGVAVTLFLILEEIDYGTHFVDLASETREPARRVVERNLHNRPVGDGQQLASYFKLAANLTLAVGFVLLPLLLHGSRHPAVRLLLPSPWCIATVVLMFVLARIAHGLDDAGFGQVNGVEGGLTLNISEFRELNLYLLGLLYVLRLGERLASDAEAGPGP